VTHSWGKGNQFCINEGAVPPGAGPNRGNKGVSFKDYSTILIQQIVPKFDVKHPCGKGKRWWSAARGLNGGAQ